MTALAPTATLALHEGRRLLLHPLSIAGWALFVTLALTTTLESNGPRSAFETTDTLATFFPGVLLIVVGNLVAHRDRRAGTLEVLGSLPTGPTQRTAALLVGSLGQVALGIVGVLGIDLLNRRLDRYLVEPGAWQILQGPVTLAGAVALGVLAAAWLRPRTAIVLVVVALVAVNVWLGARPDLAYYVPMMSWAEWGVVPGAWGGLVDGAPGWRVGYLAGLTCLAGVGALLPVARRRSLVVASGVAVLLATVLCGWLLR